MARKKIKNYVVNYGNTGYHLNDLGKEQKVRFELCYDPDDKVIMKSNDPYECFNWMKKNVWKKEFEEIEYVWSKKWMVNND